MTIQEWIGSRNERATPMVLTTDPAGPVTMMGVADRTRTPQANWELWHLSDYVVRTITAGTIWLAPRRESTL